MNESRASGIQQFNEMKMERFESWNPLKLFGNSSAQKIIAFL